MRRLAEYVKAVVVLGVFALVVLYIAALSDSPSYELWPAWEHWENALLAGGIFAVVCYLIARER